MDSNGFRDLINSNAVIEFDINGYITWANDKFLELMKCSPVDCFNLHHSIFFPKTINSLKEHEKIWAQLLAGRSYSGEFCRRCPSKQTIWIQGTYTPIRGPDGSIAKIVSLVVDITEKKNLSVRLEQQNIELTAAAIKAHAATHAKSIFLANMSHEIRTPLNSIIGITDALSETQLSDEQSAYVEILIRANNQLMNLINDVLDLSKIEAGEIEIRPRRFRLRKFLNELISVFEFRAKEKGLTLELKIDSNVPDCYILDFDRLRQALTNLINNSIKFTSSGYVKIEVTLNNSIYEGNLLFKVSDSGIGIDEGSLRDIFLPFVQGDSASTRRFGGTGLGLSITKNLIQLLNGDIWVESKKDSGSHFYFSVSGDVVELVSPDVRPLASLSELNGIDKSKQKALDILIVDDVEDNRFLIGIFLQRTHHRIYHAASGSEALRYVKQKRFDIIFMDIQMPGMDGYETTRRIRSFEKQELQIPSYIIACTANAFRDDINKSISSGCDLHLSKPLKKEILFRAIGTYFSRNPEMTPLEQCLDFNSPV